MSRTEAVALAFASEFLVAISHGQSEFYDDR